MPSKNTLSPAAAGARRKDKTSAVRPDKTNGPLPTGACPNVAEPAELAGTTDKAGDANADGSSDHGDARATRTTPGEGTVTAETTDNRSAPAAPRKT